jgi:hypothetical protein
MGQTKAEPLRMDLPAKLPGPLPLSEMMQSSPHSQLSSVKGLNPNLRTSFPKNLVAANSDSGLNSADNIQQQPDNTGFTEQIGMISSPSNVKIDTILQGQSKGVSPRNAAGGKPRSHALASSQSANQINASHVQIKVNSLTGRGDDLTLIEERQEQEQHSIKKVNTQSKSYFVTENTKSRPEELNQNVDLVSFTPSVP